MPSTLDATAQKRSDFLEVEAFFDLAKESILGQLIDKPNPDEISIAIESSDEAGFVSALPCDSLANRTHKILRLSQVRQESEISWGSLIVVWVGFLQWAFEIGFSASIIRDANSNSNYFLQMRSFN